MGVTVVACGPERAGEVHRLTQAAFDAHRRLDPPSGATRESEDVVRADLAAGGGAVAELDGRAVGCLRWTALDGADFHVRRVGVEPEHQRTGLGSALMEWAEQEATRRGCRTVSVGVRTTLDDNLAFYGGRGYELVGEHRHEGYEHATGFSLRKVLPA